MGETKIKKQLSSFSKDESCTLRVTTLVHQSLTETGLAGYSHQWSIP